MANPRSVIGLNVERLRKAAGYPTRRQFAEKVGVSPQLVADWELRRKTLDLESLVKIALGIEKPIDAIVQGFDQRYDSLDRSESSTGVPSPVTEVHGKTTPSGSPVKVGVHVSSASAPLSRRRPDPIAANRTTIARGALVGLARLAAAAAARCREAAKANAEIERVAKDFVATIQDAPAVASASDSARRDHRSAPRKRKQVGA